MNNLNKFSTGLALALSVTTATYAADFPYPYFVVDSHQTTPHVVHPGDTVTVSVDLRIGKPLSPRCEYEDCWASRIYPNGLARGSLGTNAGDGSEFGYCHIKKIDDLNYRITLSQTISDGPVGVYRFGSLSMKVACSGDANFGEIGGELFELVH